MRSLPPPSPLQQLSGALVQVGLKTHTVNILVRSHVISRIEDLQTIDDNRLLAIKGLGPEALKDIREHFSGSERRLTGCLGGNLDGTVVHVLRRMSDAERREYLEPEDTEPYIWIQTRYGTNFVRESRVA